MKHLTLSSLPATTGVYIFKNALGELLYIGKAKSIKTRVAHYFRSSNKDWKNAALLKEYATVDYLETSNEIEAYLLEAQLIQKHKPKYNILLKHGNPFVYLTFTDTDPKQLLITRDTLTPGLHVGPFLYKKDAQRVHTYLIKTFQLLLCNKTIEQGCLNYHLNLCAGNCTPLFDKEAYHTRLSLAYTIVTTQHDTYLAVIDRAIKEATSLHAYEKARNLYQYKLNFHSLFESLKLTLISNKSTFIDEEDHSSNTSAHLAVQLQQFFHAKNPIHTIDCFDISHFHGHHRVGASVRFTHGKKDKKYFRRFLIKQASNQHDDYAALEEILQRRYKHQDFPDLILIDGGKGQLGVAKKLNLQTEIASIAKKEERVFTPSCYEGMIVTPMTAVGKTLLSLRDQTHKAAITYHRLLRSKQHEI
ncbi:MAG: GIY-YIG nuclease family protein [Candidatus Babeliales bacterium]